MTETKPHSTEAGGPEHYPVLPLRDIVVFPYMIVPLFVGREKSIAALEEVMRSDKQILLVAQKNASDDEPSTDGIYTMKFDVRFYLVSLLFIIFDLEVAFLFPWAVAFGDIGMRAACAAAGTTCLR